MGAGCKPAGTSLRWFESNTLHYQTRIHERTIQLRRTTTRTSSIASSGLLGPGVYFAGVAQLVERQPSKLNVASSNLVSRSG